MHITLRFQSQRQGTLRSTLSMDRKPSPAARTKIFLRPLLDSEPFRWQDPRVMMPTRRTFISLSGRLAVGLPLLSLGACSRRDSVSATSDLGRWQSLIAHLEKEIPSRL